ncbi:hypothetical protein PVAP13_9NG013100 [Panicum virgatum]|uniref:Uncharacterized protein n=1 Tax=Panicum virgatum TaxID=38727 RepID=A0A8T0MFJ9_PANVG|nr:hypothetical protein PVAP13_9NG013100 [Panicum virgatum]
MAGKIKTVVVLVQENRSFDHMLGWFKSLNPAIDGVTGDETNRVDASDPSSRAVRFSDRAQYVDPDPGHSIQAIYEQLYGAPFVDAAATPITPPAVPAPPMSGFAQQAEKEQPGMADTVMSGFRPDAVPVYRELVREFAVCDRWFASVPASTQPNRLFVHSATSHGLVSNDAKVLVPGLPQRTIFDNLHDQGFSFGIYYQYPPSTLFYRNLRRLKYVGNFHQFDLHFRRHCREGKLPNYVVVEQRYFDLEVLGLPGNDDHPSHDVAEGQRFVKEVYEALRSSPQWEEALLVITYDEHGGFYDHVPTPVGVPSPDGIVSAAPFFFEFDRLGARVPALFVSPWIEPGTVVHRPPGPHPTSEFEHSSIPATVKNIFNIDGFLTKRDAWAGTFDSVLTRDTPRTDCPVTLPEPVKLRRTAPVEHAPLSEFQEELVQLAAVLNGDHTKDSYPHKLVEGMTVAEAAKYCVDAFRAFLDECDRYNKCGEDGSHIPTVKPPSSAPAPGKNKSSFASKGTR